MSNQNNGPAPQAPRGGAPGGGGEAPGGGRGGKKHVITFNLSPAQLLSSIGGFGIVLVWVFILGVILGKGYAPEAHIPELEKLMPKNEQADTLRVITPDNSAGGADVDEGSENTSSVIPPEDMAYRQSLKGSAQQSPPAASRGQNPPAAQQQPTRTTPPAAAQQQGAAQAGQPATQQNTPSRIQPADSQIYDYVYQVAAYRDQASCDALVQKLGRNGFKASTEKSDNNGSVWYKTLIHFRGAPDDVDKLREGLAAHKLDRLIMRSKTPVR